MKDSDYIDEAQRSALYCLVSTIKPNPQGLKLSVDKQNGTIQLLHFESKEIITTWGIYVIVGKFMVKMDKLLLVYADNIIDDTNLEGFHYNQAYLLIKPSDKKFLQTFDDGKIIIDIRMHIKEKGGVRNHGTAFRVNEQDLKLLYENVKQLM